MIVDYEDILYEVKNGVATITINRPDKYNAFRGQTCEEMIHAFLKAGWDHSIGVIVLTGAGNRAFCTGGDQSSHAGHYDGRGVIGLPLEELQSVIRDVPKPVIAKVRGYAIGGGHVLALLCDLTLTAESAKFGQVGPKVGSVDPGFGTAYLARVVGEKKAREIWYLCRQYNAQQALDMGLINAVVPLAELEAEGVKWGREILAHSPLAIRSLKSAFNADLDGQAGIQELAGNATLLYYMSEEAKEFHGAQRQKRKPNSRNFPWLP